MGVMLGWGDGYKDGEEVGMVDGAGDGKKLGAAETDGGALGMCEVEGMGLVVGDMLGIGDGYKLGAAETEGAALGVQVLPLYRQSLGSPTTSTGGTPSIQSCKRRRESASCFRVRTLSLAPIRRPCRWWLYAFALVGRKKVIHLTAATTESIVNPLILGRQY